MSRGTVYPFIADQLRRAIRPGMTVLETGAGACMYRPHVQDCGARYFGTDVHNEHYQSEGDVQVYCSADKLPFRNDVFDLVFNQAALDYQPNPDQTLAEAFRVLKSGGAIMIATYDEETLRMIDRNCRQTGRAWEQSHHVFTIADLTAWLTKSGFKHVDDHTREIEGLAMPPRWRRWLGFDSYHPKTAWRLVMGWKNP